MKRPATFRLLRSELNKALKQAAEDVARTQVTAYISDIREQDFNVQQYLKNMEADGLLILYSWLSLTPELESLEVLTNVELYHKASASRPEKKTYEPKPAIVLSQRG